ncbi:MAG: YybH family protein [Verrucomicrobiota bacterium]
MQDDEQAIRKLVQNWLAASKNGDLKTILSLMSDDVVFMVPGREPFGKEEFTSNNERMKGVRIEGESNIQEIKVLGDWAWMRNQLKVTITPPGGESSVYSGYVLTILQKQSAGNWVITRDANLLTPTS